MNVLRPQEQEVFVRTTDDPSEVAAFQREAELLRFAAHPGVVELLGSDPIEGGRWQLRLRRVEGGAVTAQPLWSLEEVTGYGAAAATTLADLHDLGVVHRRLTPDHLLVDGSGRPVICGFGQSVRALPEPEQTDLQAEDVACLIRSLRERMPDPFPRRLARSMERGPGRRRKPLSARQLARVLGEDVPGSRLPAVGMRGGELPADPFIPTAPGPSRPVGPTPPAANMRPARGPRFGMVIAGLVVLVIVAGLLIGGTMTGGKSRSTPIDHPGVWRSGPLRGPTSAVCPPVDAGCEPLVTPGGVLTVGESRYRLAAAGDLVVLGRWRCTARSLPAVLRLRSGQVWVFTRWATTGGPSTAGLVAVVAGARSLRVLAEGSGCDRLEVERAPTLRPVLLTPEP